MRSFLALLSLSLPTALFSTETTPALDSSAFEVLHELVDSTPAESKWEAIGWRTDLWKARQEAARVGKPIYLWEMDGHPLGCT